MLAASAATLPRGHVLVEPYLYDVISAHQQNLGSLTYLLYGLADGLSVGAIPVVSFSMGHGQPSTAGPRLGDLTLQAQYQLTQYHETQWLPSLSLVVQETLPTGRFDRLGGRKNEGTGAGTYTTTLALFSQTYFWLPNGRLLRTRLDISDAISERVSLLDESVYDTPRGFRGHVAPGQSLLVDAAAEYSMTREWVWALDVIYRKAADTVISGIGKDGMSLRERVHKAPTFGVAPAIEYNWGSNLGVLLGMRVVPGTHATATTITPAVALNRVF